MLVMRDAMRDKMLVMRDAMRDKMLVPDCVRYRGGSLYILCCYTLRLER